MRSKERVLAAINHEVPDRVPIDLGSTVNSSMVKESYERLREFIGFKPKNSELLSRMMRTSRIHSDVHDYLDTDLRGVFPGSLGTKEWLDENTYSDPWGITRRKKEGFYYYEQIEYPLSGDIEKEDIENYDWPNPNHPDLTEGLERKVEELKQNTDSAIVLKLPSCFIHKSQYLRGFEDWYLDCARDSDLILFLFDKILDLSLVMVKNILSLVGDEVDIVMTSDDLGAQDGLQVSPNYFRERIKPRFRKYFEAVQGKSSDAQVLFHSCGAISPIIEDLIELGVDALNPVQVSASGMGAKKLSDNYGDRVTFWGGIDTQQVLNNGEPEDVKRAVKHNINTLGPKGGYILGAVHNIQPGVPPENVLTMYDYGKQYSKEYYGNS